MSEIMDLEITEHAQQRWNSRRPNQDLIATLENARRDSYHPMAVRAIASWRGDKRPGQYYLVTRDGVVFIMAGVNGKRVLITVLVPESSVFIDRFDNIENMTREECRKALEQTSQRYDDVLVIRSQLIEKRVELEARFRKLNKMAKRKKGK